MASSEKKELNKTQGEEIQIPCSKCLGKTYHHIELSVDKSYEKTTENDDYFCWFAHYQIISCKGCATISFRLIKYNHDDFEPIGDDEWQPVVYEELYPFRIERRKGIANDELFLLPNNVQRIYEDTLQALNSKSSVLTGIGLRALVETVCKEKNAINGNLEKKIKELETKNILTPAIAEVLHKIRTLGNNAAHETKPHSEKQLALAMDVVEHLLKDVYIFPKQVSLQFDKE